MKKIILLSLFFILACSGKNHKEQLNAIAQNDSLMVIDIDNSNNINTGNYSDIFNNVKAIILESSPDCLIGHISKIQIINNRIILLDNTVAQGVFIFDLNGKFIKRIGRIGQGPGEYLDVNDFALDEASSSLLVLDVRLQKINIYNLDTGTYIKSLSLKGDKGVRSYHIYYDNNNNLYADAYFYYPSKKNYLLRKFDLQTGTQTAKFLNIVNYNKGWNNLYFIENNAFYNSNSKKEAYFTQQFMDTIISIKYNKINPYAVIKSKDFITDKDIKEIDKNTKNKYFPEELIKKDKIWEIRDLFEYKKYIYFHCRKYNYQLNVLYNKTTKKTSLIRIENNDILYNEKIEEGIPERFLYSNKNGIYTYIRLKDIALLTAYARENLLSLPSSQIDSLKKLSDDSNPVILSYEFKK